ncbi:hypothetical protein AB9K34_09280 [Sedimentitalea sp. XS_ASV28]|uniref:hypothetical protein n=1 Tax=Sedimentitalea sp. XS_ASV28 TaxID=3241296 RepID=UPI003514D125
MPRAGWDRGVRACAICPGFTATNMTLRHDLPREEITQPEDIGRLVAEVVCLPSSAGVSELAVSRVCDASSRAGSPGATSACQTRPTSATRRHHHRLFRRPLGFGTGVAGGTGRKKGRIAEEQSGRNWG